MIVVDASLAVKWFLLEEESDRAEAFFDAYHGSLVAPDLLGSEVASALVRRANMRLATPADTAELLDSWIAIWSAGGLKSYRLTTPMLRQATALAVDLGHPLPDCIYLALAMELGATLATCDAKFRDRALAAYRDIKLLADFAA